MTTPDDINRALDELRRDVAEMTRLAKKASTLLEVAERERDEARVDLHFLADAFKSHNIKPSMTVRSILDRWSTTTDTALPEPSQEQLAVAFTYMSSLQEIARGFERAMKPASSRQLVDAQLILEEGEDRIARLTLLGRRAVSRLRTGCEITPPPGWVCPVRPIDEGTGAPLAVCGARAKKMWVHGDYASVTCACLDCGHRSSV